jgi:S1-C subfamily serine protease
LKPGDLIIHVARTPVPDPPALFAVLSGERIGRATEVELIRHGRRLTVTVRPWRLDA